MTSPQWIMIALLIIETFAHGIRVRKRLGDDIVLIMIGVMGRMGVLISVLFWGGFWN